jgi:hypothetical protein
MNRTRPTGYIKEDVVGITTVADHAVELIFNLQIIILVEGMSCAATRNLTPRSGKTSYSGRTSKTSNINNEINNTIID